MYRIRVYDNFHYMDEDCTYLDPKEYPTMEAAIAAAKKSVEEQCEQYGYDISLYRGFGDDPSVVGHPEGVVVFSGWKYAEELCRAKKGE